MGNSKGIFENWLKNFATIVFTQSFQAVFMVFTIKIVYGLIDKRDPTEIMTTFDNRSTLIGIVIIVSSMAMIKFEKLVRKLFGISESDLLGNTNTAFKATLAGLASAGNMAKRTAEPFVKYKDQKRKVDRLKQNRDNLKKEFDGLNVPQQSGANTNASIGNHSFENSNIENLNASNAPAAFVDQHGNTLIPGSNASNNSSNNGMTGADNANLTNALNNLVNSINKQTAQVDSKELKKKEKKLAEAEQEYQDAERDKTILSRQRFSRLGSTIASTSVGLGATDNLNDAAMVANTIDYPLDKLTDRKISNSANRKAFNATDDERFLKEINDGVIKSVASAWKDSIKESKNLTKDMIMPTSMQKNVKVNDNNLSRSKDTTKVTVSINGNRMDSNGSKVNNVKINDVDSL